jgi:signal transduction histidine kinase
LNSLERSLQIGLVSSLIALMFVFWWTATLTSRLLTESFVYRTLEVDARSVVSILEIPAVADQTPHLGNYKLNPAYAVPASGEYFVIQVADRRLMSRSAWDQFLDIPPMVPGQQQKRRVTGVAGEPLLIWSGGFRRSGHDITVAVARNISPIADRLRVFQWFAAIIALLLLTATLGVQRWIVRGSVQKLDAIRLDMLKLEHGTTVSLSEDVPSEIAPLVKEFNRLLRRFDQRLRQSRNAVGNLAHAIKGPLHLLLRSTESEIIGRDERAVIAQNTEHITRLIESELKRARMAGRGTVGQRFDSEKSVDIRYNIGPEVELVHDRQDMLELIGNLLDNAVKWSRSLVIVNIRQANGILIEVEDDGPGCSPEELGRLTGRGVRLDETVAGHGLGLAIVKDIVETYEGRLSLEASTRLSGLKASAYLPATAADRR